MQKTFWDAFHIPTPTSDSFFNELEVILTDSYPLFELVPDIAERIKKLLANLQKLNRRKSFLMEKQIEKERSELSEALGHISLPLALELRNSIDKCWQDYLNSYQEARRPLEEDLAEQPQAYIEALQYHLDNLGILDFDAELNKRLESKFITAIRSVIAKVRKRELDHNDPEGLIVQLKEIYSLIQQTACWDSALRVLEYLGPLSTLEVGESPEVAPVRELSDQLFQCLKNEYAHLAIHDLLSLVFDLENRHISELEQTETVTILRSYFGDLGYLDLGDRAVKLVLAIHGLLIVRQVTVGNPDKFFSLET